MLRYVCCCHTRWVGGGRRGVALTVPVTECGVTGVTGVVSVFHREAARPLQPAGLLRSPRLLTGPVGVSGARGGVQQASLAVVYKWDRRGSHSATVTPADLWGGAVGQHS